jgi:hypothetical protein
MNTLPSFPSPPDLHVKNEFHITASFQIFLDISKTFFALFLKLLQILFTSHHSFIAVVEEMNSLCSFLKTRCYLFIQTFPEFIISVKHTHWQSVAVSMLLAKRLAFKLKFSDGKDSQSICIGWVKLPG